MKKYILFLIIASLSVSCNGQESETTKAETNDNQSNPTEPKGTWKVDKEFDELGNLIRYDSIYSWSSDNEYENLSSIDRDSLMRSFESRFYTNFSRFEDEGFEDIFSQDSLFSERFFNQDFFGSNFGKDFMDLDNIREQMIARQKKFLNKYQSEFFTPEEDN
ncbi:hypothetical protein [Aurantibacter sp.]|uniref:hypothetical protein n=1 Tax=Aurantibacter sp. TaxID=2807103 RepID=UPI003267DBE8